MTPIRPSTVGIVTLLSLASANVARASSDPRPLDVALTSTRTGSGGDMDDSFDRRRFVELAALGLTGVANVGSLEWLRARLSRLEDAFPSARAVFVRPEIHSAAGQAMIPAYSAGVAAMRARSVANANDQTGWDYQWKMHGTYDAATKLAWKTCQHNNFLFVTWHRMYLYYFERIMRKASGNPAFALPYWNYEPAGQRQLPLAFRSNPTSNPLYWDARGDHMNDGTGEVASGSPVWALAATQFNGAAPAGFGGGVVTGPTHFSVFDGRLEVQPHNLVHGDIGGDMGDPNTAANDPVFWLHHANIDRLWSYWRVLDPATHTDPTSNTVWMNTKFTFFDENGATVQMKGADVLDSAGQLGYRYDSEFVFTPAQLAALREMLRQRRPPFDFRFFRRPFPWPPEPPPELRTAVALTKQPVTINAVQTVTTLPIQRETVAGLRSALAQPSRAAHPILVLEGLSVRRPPGGRVDVFVLAGGQSTAAAMKIATAAPATVYVGSLDFFSIFGQFGTARGVQDATLAVEISEVMRRQLQQLSPNGDTLSVLFQFQGVRISKEQSLAPPSNPIRINSVSLRFATGGAGR